MNTTTNISNKGDDRVNENQRVPGVARPPRRGAGRSRSRTSTPLHHRLKDTETDVSMGATITMQDYAIRTIEANLLRSALADAERKAEAKPDADVKERRFIRRMRRNLNRLEPTLAYLNGRAYDVLKHSDQQISAAYGVMKGETEPSAFLVVSEPCRTTSGEALGERHLLETHRPNDVLDFFGLEAAK